jgi:23S rRNA (cytosine1962-C5)-methyltransferase
LIHAEGDGLSGLTVDCYGDQLVVQTTSLGMDQRLPMITEALVEVMAPSRIIERNDSIGRSMEGLEPRKSVLYQKQRSSFGDSVRVEMNGLEWDIPLDQGHKTAVYLDQYENYRRLGELTASMKAPRVLDAFTFMGGFALHCAKAGASKVIAIDQSQEALQAADQSARANDLEPRCEWIHGNVFDWLKEHSKEPDADSLFDLIILDPPSFTRNRRSMGDAMRGYKEIHLRAMRLLKPGGLLATFCCSHHIDAQAFESSVIQAAMDNRWILRRVASFGQPADHPVVPSIPETQYLKGFCYQRLEDGFIADPEVPSARA